MSEPTPPFTVDPSLAAYDIRMKEYLLQTNDDSATYNGLVAATAVFNPSGHLLLLQRASHDSMPNKWELPGGAVDPSDPSILHGAARELFEEAGLQARRFTHLIPDANPAFTNRDGTKTFRRFAFLVEVEGWERVRLDPNEHQDYVWATEEEVRGQRRAERELPITHESVVAIMLGVFRLHRERRVTPVAKV